MKQAILLATLILIGASTTFAQNTESTDTVSNQGGQMNCCMMQQGKMTCMMMGKMSPMEKDMMLSDSTIVKPDGTVIRKNGEKMKMGDGMCCDMMGNIYKTCEHQKGRKQNQKRAYYACPMHSAETGTPAKCPKCGMMLKEQK